MGRIKDYATTTPAAGQFIAVDNASGTKKVDASSLMTLVVSVSAFDSLPQTVSNSKITSGHVVLNSVLSNPSAQTGDWTVTTSNGSVSISGDISGSTALTLYLGISG